MTDNAILDVDYGFTMDDVLPAIDAMIDDELANGIDYGLLVCKCADCMAGGELE